MVTRPRVFQRRLIANGYQNWIRLKRQAANIDAEISTQIVINRLNTVQSQWYENLYTHQDFGKSSQEICNTQIKQIASTSQQILLDLAKANYEEKLIETFIDRLYHPTLLQTEIINTTPIPDSEHIITIVSSFIISEPKRNQLTTVIREKIAKNAKIKFKTKEDYLSRIELRDRGYKISWNLEHYLTELETVTAKVLTKNSSSTTNHAHI